MRRHSFLPSKLADGLLKKMFFSALLCVLFSAQLDAQKATTRFNRLTIDDGLSLSSVYCIFEDSKGFMWFGTEDGLNKYDGKKFTIYRPQAGIENSLSYKWTEIIFEDSRGKLWFGSKGGLSFFNPLNETFRQYHHHVQNKATLSNDTITVINEGSDGSIWIGTLAGLNRIEPKSGNAERVSLIGNNKTFSSSRIFDIVTKPNGDIWVATEDGLFFASPKKPVFNLFASKTENLNQRVYTLGVENNTLWAGTDKGLVSYDMKTGLENLFEIGPYDDNADYETRIEKLVLDKQGNIWAGTPGGLFLFNHKTGKFSCLAEARDVSQSLSVNTAKPICLDSRDNLWYGTFGSGLYRINTQKMEVENYLNNAADPTSLSQNSINCIFEDRSGVIWIGTFGAGISVYDRLAHKFRLLTHDPLDENSLSGNFIWTIFEADDGSLWVGTNTTGLNRYSPKTGKFSRFVHDDAVQGSLSAGSVRKVFQDSKGIIWVGTDGGGLNRFDSKTEKFIHYVSDPDNPQTLSSNSVRVISEDRAGNLWIGTRNGLNKFDRNTGICKRFVNDPSNPSSISHNFIYSEIYEDHLGNLWIGTYGGGLNKMDVQHETFKSFTYHPEIAGSISNDIVFSVYEDKNGILWIGTNDGLNRFDPQQKKFKRFGIQQGLPNDVIYGVLPDGQNNIWLSTNYGISKFNLTDYKVQNFDVYDGLQSNEFNGGAFHAGKSGNLYFGGVYGLNIINPEKVIKTIENTANIVLTGIDILGKKVHVGNVALADKHNPLPGMPIDAGDHFLMENAIAYADGIKLDYKHRFLGFEFAALNVPPSEKMVYSYKMENMDEDWINSGSRSYVTYANMAPGNYTFKVRAVNESGEISPNIAEFKIAIDSPYWKTWWFYLIELLLAFTIIAFVYIYLLKTRTNKLLLVQNEKIQEANRQLSASENKLKILNTTKDKFFSIIAHDLKNPFTSLLSISETLSQNYEALDEKDKKLGIDVFHNSARRIYSLLENLLVWSRTQTGMVKFTPQEFDIAELAEECYDLLALNAEEKGLEFQIWTGEDQRVFADREMIHTVIRNLLHNAIKFSKPGGKVTLLIKETDDHLVKIAVKDEGIGIPADKLGEIFNLASKSKCDGTAGEKGTGLGLIVCKEFVEKNNSKLIVKSKVGEGSEFSFYLKLV
ncbi:MAG: hypothetical protein IH595_11020 [Bacteroidales bacterium]|nr:hypothetical protein [Bacteroidales bacterium]